MISVKKIDQKFYRHGGGAMTSFWQFPVQEQYK